MDLKRNRTTGLEQYYTPSTIAKQCVESLKIDLNSYQVVEPSAGTGSFLEYLPDSTIALDIEPKHLKVKQQDFLTSTKPSTDKPLLAIGNPPFGRAASLAVKFFNHCASMDFEVIAFILPKSFLKWSIQDRLHRNYKLVSSINLNTYYVDDVGEPISKNSKLKTVWQVWQRVPELRQLHKYKYKGHIEKSSIEEANVCIELFGYSCGKVWVGANLPPETTCKGYFKCSAEAIKALESGLDFNKYSQNTSYTPALSIIEIRYLIWQYLNVPVD